MKKSLLFLSLIASFTINAQWIEQNSGFTEEFRGLTEIKIVDANTVWALAYDGSAAGDNIQECTRTIDGGTTWISFGPMDLGNPLLEINNISPVNGTTAWISALVPEEGQGSVYKTEDSGASWSVTSLDGQGFISGSSFINGVYFWNANIGVAYGDPIGSGANRKFEIWRTIDGGVTWNQIITPTVSTANPLTNEFGYNTPPDVRGNTLWFTTDHGRLIRTDDMGLTWSGYQSPLTDFGGVSASTGNGTRGDVYFSDANIGYLLKDVLTGSSSNRLHTRTFYTTTNGGQTWSSTALPFTGTRPLLNYIPGTTVMVGTSFGTATGNTPPTPVGTSVSYDNGSTWTDLEPGGTTQRGFTDFLSPSIGWCGGFSDSDPLVTAGVFKLSGSLATPTVGAVAKFKIYPNPATSMVTISAADVDSYKLSVTDISGKVVMTKSLNGIENTVDVSSLSSGAYFFELASDNKREVVKILKN